MKALRPLLLAAVLWPVPLAAASTPDAAAADAPAANLADRIADLNHPDYATRQDATDALLCDDQLELDALAAVAHATGQPLTPEARQRLLSIARHHTLQNLRLRSFPADGPGSIGIVQAVRAEPLPDQREPEVYVLVTGVLPGFPAYGRLRTLDRITALNGQRIPEPAQPSSFQAMLAPLKANETVELSVTRARATITVSLTLANRAALSGLYAPPNHTLHPRFAAEWAERRKPFEWPADGDSPEDPATPADPPAASAEPPIEP